MSSTDRVVLTSVNIVSCDGQNARRKKKSGVNNGQKKASMSDESRAKVGRRADENFARYRETKEREEDVKRRQEQEDKEKETLQERKKKIKKSKRAEEGGKKKKAVARTKEKATASDDPAEREIKGDEESDTDDDDFQSEDWAIVDHAVDKVTKKPKFKAITGKRFDGREKFCWGERKELKKDGVRGIDEYIQNKCSNKLFTALLPKKKNEALAPPLKVAARRKPCNHAVYQEQITYKAERHAGYCGQGHYLFGARCNHCRVKIGSKNNKEKDGERTIVPTSNAPLYVCVNIGLKDETGVACVQVICDGCWTVGTVSQSREAGAGRSSRSSIG